MGLCHDGGDDDSKFVKQFTNKTIAAFNQQLRLVVLGQKGVGKTTFLNCITEGLFEDDVSMAEKEFKLKSGEYVDVMFVDGTQAPGLDGTLGHFRRSSLGILIFDMTRKETFDCLQEQRKKYFRQSLQSSSHTPMIIIGNKKDLWGKRQVHKSDIDEYLKKQPTDLYFEVSSMDDLENDEFEEKNEEQIHLMMQKILEQANILEQKQRTTQQRLTIKLSD